MAVSLLIIIAVVICLLTYSMMSNTRALWSYTLCAVMHAIVCNTMQLFCDWVTLRLEPVQLRTVYCSTTCTVGVYGYNRHDWSKLELCGAHTPRALHDFWHHTAISLEPCGITYTYVVHVACTSWLDNPYLQLAVMSAWRSRKVKKL